jgi:hypothetical protein
MREGSMKIMNDNNGMVLIMVLLFMITSIIIGITLMISSMTETKIVGNERLYNQDFYLAESAGELIIPQFDTLVSSTTWTEDTRVDVSDLMPSGSIVDGINVGMTLRRTGSPPTGSGSSATKTTAFYYRVDSTVNNHNIEIGVWKAFPKPGT